MSISPHKSYKTRPIHLFNFTDSPTGVETRIGMSSNSQCKLRPVANEEDTYENVEPGSNNTEAMQSQIKRLPLIPSLSRPKSGRDWHPHLPSYVSKPTNLNLNIPNIMN